jgi:hypothetical protein
VLKALSGALNVSAETLLAQAGLIDAMTAGANGAADTQEPNALGTEQVIAADPRLGDDQKAALIAVYRSMLASAPPASEPPASEPPASEPPASEPLASAAPVTED